MGVWGKKYSSNKRGLIYFWYIHWKIIWKDRYWVIEWTKYKRLVYWLYWIRWKYLLFCYQPSEFRKCHRQCCFRNNYRNIKFFILLKRKILYSQKLRRLMPINTSVYQDNQSLKVSAYIVNVGLWNIYRITDF